MIAALKNNWNSKGKNNNWHNFVKCKNTICMASVYKYYLLSLKLYQSFQITLHFPIRTYSCHTFQWTHLFSHESIVTRWNLVKTHLCAGADCWQNRLSISWKSILALFGFVSSFFNSLDQMLFLPQTLLTGNLFQLKVRIFDLGLGVLNWGSSVGVAEGGGGPPITPWGWIGMGFLDHTFYNLKKFTSSSIYWGVKHFLQELGF